MLPGPAAERDAAAAAVAAAGSREAASAHSGAGGPPSRKRKMKSGKGKRGATSSGGPAVDATQPSACSNSGGGGGGGGGSSMGASEAAPRKKKKKHKSKKINKGVKAGLPHADAAARDGGGGGGGGGRRAGKGPDADHGPPSAAADSAGASSDEEEELEGVYVGDELYLRGLASNSVYAAIRNDRGGLVRVGRWEGGKAAIDVADDAAPEAAAAAAPAPAVADHPFPVDADDHCETPPEAFAHVAPVLDALAAELGSDRAHLRLWDPYFCAGSSAVRLGEIGFASVHHECVDFYAVVASGTRPPHDVIVTNPPFSGDHIPRFLDATRAGGRPWCMLAPNWVYTKDYFAPHASGVFFVVPDKRYRFIPPRGARTAKASDTHKRTSPFPCFWYCGGLSPVVVTRLLGAVLPGAAVARAASQLPFHALADYDPRRKKMRSALKRKRKRKSGGGEGSGGGDAA